MIFKNIQYTNYQVSHHPPISSFIIQNLKTNTELTSNLSFGVKFGGNYVSIVTEGNTKIYCHKFNEYYELSKLLPGFLYLINNNYLMLDMVIKNVIFGTKKIFWNGQISVVCPQTNYSSTIHYKENGTFSMYININLQKGNENIVEGYIQNGQGDLLFSFEGNAGIKYFQKYMYLFIFRIYNK